MGYPKTDSVVAELDAFTDAIKGKRPFPVTADEVLATLSAFEAALESIKSGQPVFCNKELHAGRNCEKRDL
jgi:predicted dehydrogenase